MAIDYFDSNESKMSSARTISFITWLVDETKQWRVVLMQIIRTRNLIMYFTIRRMKCFTQLIQLSKNWWRTSPFNGYAIMIRSDWRTALPNLFCSKLHSQKVSTNKYNYDNNHDSYKTIVRRSFLCNFYTKLICTNVCLSK